LEYVWKFIVYLVKDYWKLYKDAIEYELKIKGIKYEREKNYKIEYKEIILPHHFIADFVINNVIVEIKVQNKTVGEHYSQIINYITISKSKVGLLINFGESSLKYKRFVI
jgi:GxxExxY protein